LNSRWNPTRLQQLPDVAGITGQYKVAWRGHQRNVCVDDVSGTSHRQKFSDPLAVILIKGLPIDAG